MWRPTNREHTKKKVLQYNDAVCSSAIFCLSFFVTLKVLLCKRVFIIIYTTYVISTSSSEVSETRNCQSSIRRPWSVLCILMYLTPVSSSDVHKLNSRSLVRFSYPCLLFKIWLATITIVIPIINTYLYYYLLYTLYLYIHMI